MGRQHCPEYRGEPKSPDPDRRRDAEALLMFAHEIVVPDSRAAQRARKIQQQGFSPFDALHLASAEQGLADVFLTTDDALLRRAMRSLGGLRVRVENPVFWYQEKKA